MNIDVHCNMFVGGTMSDTKKLFTIGEVAKSLGITRRIIINYEDHGLINADSRGDDNKGYRYYSIDALVRMKTIRNFQNFGLTLDEIKEYMEGGASLVSALERLESLRDELNLNIEKLRERIKTDNTFSPTISELLPQTIYFRTMRDTLIEDRTNHLRDTAYEAIETYGVNHSRRMYLIEYDLDDPDYITYCASIPNGCTGKNVIELPRVSVISYCHHGAYEELAAVRKKLIEYANDRNIALTGKCRHVYLEGPPQHNDPHKYITLVALIIKD